ncbi:hypothetical protein GF322_05065 [Candidatus Dependentiae bacterium]|nr:hypothetical protein [Candidatus Dependentiae bacterium]
MFKNKKFKTLHIFLLIFIALITIVWFIQQDDRIQNFVQKQIIKTLEKEWNTKINVKSSKFNIFTGKIIIENGVIKSTNNNFFWKFKISNTSFSRLALIFKQKLILHVKLNDIIAYSRTINGQPAIIHHMQKIFQTNPKIPVNLKKVTIKDLDFKLIQSFNFKDSNEIGIKLQGKLKLTKQSPSELWQGNLNLLKGILNLNNKNLLNLKKGSFDFKTTTTGNIILNSIQDFNCLNQNYLLNFQLNKNKKNIKIESEDSLLNIKIDNLLNDNNYIITGTIPIKILQNIYNFSKNQNFTSNLNITKDVINLDLIFANSSQKLKLGGILKYKNIDFNLQSTWSSSRNRGNFLISNNNLINLNMFNLFIPQKGFKFCAIFNKELQTKVKYQIELLQNQVNKKHIFSGYCFYNNKNLKISGTNKKGKYFLKINLEKNIFLSKLLYINNMGQKLIKFSTPKNNQFLTGIIKYDLIRNLLPYQIQKNIVGRQAYFDLNINQTLNGLQGSFKLSKGKLSFLGIYNPIKYIQSQFDINFWSKTLSLQDLKINFYRGSINLSNSKLSLDEDNEIKFLEIPLHINNLLVNWNKAFYGIIRGNLFLNKKFTTNIYTQKLQGFNKLNDSSYKIMGSLFLEKTLIKENTFSQNSELNFKNNFFSFEPLFINDKLLEIDINILSDSPLKLKTKLLTAEAFLDLNVKTFYGDNNFFLPKIVGEINLDKGHINFFKNKLYIDYATVQFLPTQPNEPIIDLLAKNKINKYLINLQVTGAVSNPHIILDSSPDLREEEIISLLFTGYESANLQTNFPVILMQNIEDLINLEKIFNKSTPFFKKIITPFKYVQITPNFSNQSGGGGIKGTISVDLNKQIYAQLQKNFNLQDDLTFQIEYLLTDDINLKMIKDQRGELGAQVEVRLRL